ncbi:FHA domain-containing protein [Glaciihabitans sp. UYNi722]|uniref:FHA domain-containing protein n=1 Tax=Glaciihabitans sp. UYNi722 TaxID=3156344 RepID=UPI003392A513
MAPAASAANQSSANQFSANQFSANQSTRAIRLPLTEEPMSPAAPALRQPPVKTSPEATLADSVADNPAQADLSSGAEVPEEESSPEPLVEPAFDGLRCTQCGARMSPNDIFCGECGHVSHEISASFSRPRDTVVIEPLSFALSPPPSIPTPPPAALTPPTDRPRPEAVEHLAGTSDESSDASSDADDLEATRIVNPSRKGGRFILQFSTGETFTVYGSGLVGRNPQPEPGEYFDQLIRVLDPSRSVSKTHLEFGQDSGAFWLKDRYSGNGTIVREPDSPPVRCQPEKRVRIVRGTRVDIGEQFFIIS